MSASSIALRQQIEASLAARIPAALSVRFREAPELVATGIAEIDALLQGGIPLGDLCEVVGPASSGKTTLVSSLLAKATQQGAACAYVDVADTFDPLSGAAIGINLERLLWVRAGRAEEHGHASSARLGWARPDWAQLDRALRATDLLLSAGGFRVIVLDMGDVRDDQVRRVPLASWYRYRLQAEKSQALFLLVTQVPCAKSCASLLLQCGEAQERWGFAAVETSLEAPSEKRPSLLHGFRFRVSANSKRRGMSHEPAHETVLPERVLKFGAKPASSAETFWQRTTQWAR